MDLLNGLQISIHSFKLPFSLFNQVFAWFHRGLNTFIDEDSVEVAEKRDTILYLFFQTSFTSILSSFLCVFIGYTARFNRCK